MVASVEAGGARRHTRRLDLQISLLTEHEITRLITLVAGIAGRMEIEEAHNPELAELSRDVQVIERMEDYERDAGSESQQ